MKDHRSQKAVELFGEGAGAGGVGPGVEQSQAEHEAADVDRQGVEAEAADEGGDPVLAEAEKEDQGTQDPVGDPPSPSVQPFVEKGIAQRRRQEGGEIDQVRRAEGLAAHARRQIFSVNPEHAPFPASFRAEAPPFR